MMMLREEAHVVDALIEEVIIDPHPIGLQRGVLCESAGLGQPRTRLEDREPDEQSHDCDEDWNSAASLAR